MRYIYTWLLFEKLRWCHMRVMESKTLTTCHDDVIKWKHFPRYWPFVRGIHRSTVNSPHKGQWRGAFVFSLICVWINGWINNREAGDLRRYHARYDVIVMFFTSLLRTATKKPSKHHIDGDPNPDQSVHTCSYTHVQKIPPFSRILDVQTPFFKPKSLIF